MVLDSTFDSSDRIQAESPSNGLGSDRCEFSTAVYIGFWVMTLGPFRRHFPRASGHRELDNNLFSAEQHRTR